MQSIDNKKIIADNRITASKKAILFCALSAVIVAQSACQSRFIGANVTPSAAGNEIDGISPNESEEGSPKPTATKPQENPIKSPEVCFERHKAARLFFIVDNSNSHGYLDNDSNNRIGTDPVRVTQSIRGKLEAKTYRQEALYSIMKRLIEIDSKAVNSSTDFLGTEIGMAYFPKYRGDGNPSTRYPDELEDLKQYVMVSGPNGISQSIFSKPISPLANVRSMSAETIDEELWNSLRFTHTPGGSTPYATGLKAAVDNLIPASADPTDPRENIVFFLTDGLPTDETPSEIIKLRDSLGSTTKFFVLKVFDPNEDPSITESPLYRNLKAAFLGPTNWATKSGNPDRYQKTESGFQQYWSELTAISDKISDKVIHVPNAEKLASELDRILEHTTTCSQ